MDRLAARLAALLEGGVMSIPMGISPIESSAGTPIQVFGDRITVGADGGMTYWGKRVAGIDELKYTLERNRAVRERARRDGPFYVWPDRSAPAAKVAELLAALPEELEVRLAFAGPERQITAYEEELLAVPRVKRSLEEVRGADDISERARIVAETMSPTIGMCEPLIRTVGELGGMHAEQRAALSSTRFPEAIRECRCNVGDLVMLEYLLLLSNGAFRHPPRSVPAAEATSVLR